jgi:hypothetical protein
MHEHKRPLPSQPPVPKQFPALIVSSTLEQPLQSALLVTLTELATQAIEYLQKGWIKCHVRFMNEWRSCTLPRDGYTKAIKGEVQQAKGGAHQDSTPMPSV